MTRQHPDGFAYEFEHHPRADPCVSFPDLTEFGVFLVVARRTEGPRWDRLVREARQHQIDLLRTPR